MLERLNLKKQPNENLLMEFITKIPSKDADSVLLRFTEYKMAKRLKQQREMGFSGWNTPQCGNSDLLKRLRDNLDRGEYLDVINLAAMLLARENMFVEKHL